MIVPTMAAAVSGVVVQRAADADRQPVASAEASAETLAAPTFWMPDTGSGWISFDPIESGQIIIPVTLNGEPVRALIDTGFDQLLISKRFANIHRLPLTPRTERASFGGQTLFYSTPAVTLDIGAMRTTKPGAVAVTDLSRMSGAGLKQFDVVIGLTLLAKVEWQVDRDRHRMRILRSGTVAIADGIPIRWGPAVARLVTDIGVNGKILTPTMIDTGSDAEVSLPLPSADIVGFHGETDMASIGIGGSVVQPLGRLRDFSIGQRVLPNPYATIDGWFVGHGIKALIGMGVLQNYNMTIDLGAGKMALDARLTVLPPMAKSTSGVQGSYADGRLSIAHVMKNSPAAAAGLKDGDAICAIDGAAISQAMIDRHWGRAAPGTRYTLKLCDGSVHAITLTSFY